MDPVCHTLVGATLARTGLERRTPLATAALVIGANIPDVDVLAYVAGPTSALAFRRGWTHGVLAVALWPFVLCGAIWLWHRLVRQRLRPDTPPVRPTQLLLLSAVAVLTHPLLDFLNTYGMRWLMPFSARWFYGDTLFIVDPWVWAALAVGWFAAGRPVAGGGGAPRVWPARLALAGLGVYVVVLAGIGRLARYDVSRELVSRGLGAPDRVMVSPIPVTPFRRVVVAEIDGVYRVGSHDVFGRPRVALEALALPRYDPQSVPRVAAESPDLRRFLQWARFPYVDVDARADETTVHVGDARYTMDPTDSWAAVTVIVDR